MTSRNYPFINTPTLRIWFLVVLGIIIIIMAVLYRDSIPRFLSTAGLVLPPVHQVPLRNYNGLLNKQQQQQQHTRTKPFQANVKKYSSHPEPHQVYWEKCYVYHPENFTAENRCCRMHDYTSSPLAFHTCIQKDLDVNNRDVKWMLVGDSHMRYLFSDLLTTISGPHLKFMLTKSERVWKDGSNINTTMSIRAKAQHEKIVAIDDHINFTLTFHWDHLLNRLPRMANEWLKNSTQTPSLIVFSGALHNIIQAQKLYITGGPKAAAQQYRQHLLQLRPSLVRLAASTRVVFKLVDHLWQTMLRKETQNAVHDGWNYALFNEVAVDVLSGTGVVIWNSTLPMSYLYALECIRSPHRRTLPSRHWNCPDTVHVGYILVSQYTNMVLNDYCNRFLGFGEEYCL
ncbi:hypothetical protein Pcinc_013394 [Petrolisthes cinctipes]|uniref:Uncharacterized protein n=1 Tax=Petrolisthes cinctipes TaxID=88211 RepID=A0AAE1FYR4_PETCI|nr:hypothetical protein Pcinc_013394 [Petrolisthes cinctipes]